MKDFLYGVSGTAGVMLLFGISPIDVLGISLIAVWIGGFTVPLIWPEEK